MSRQKQCGISNEPGGTKQVSEASRSEGLELGRQSLGGKGTANSKMLSCTCGKLSAVPRTLVKAGCDSAHL